MEQLANINILAVITAGGASFFIGFLWYSVLFTKPWMKAMGVTAEDVHSSGISTKRAIIGSFAASLATAAGLATIYELIPNLNWGTGMLLALVVWIAFSLTPMFKMVFWEDRPVSLFSIDGGYEFFSILVVAIVLLVWP